MKNLSGITNELPPLSKRKLAAMSPSEMERFLSGGAYFGMDRPYRNRMKLLKDFVDAKAESGALRDFNEADIEKVISLFEFYNSSVPLFRMSYNSSNQEKEAIRTNQQFVYDVILRWIDQKNQISPDEFEFIQRRGNHPLFRQDLLSRCFEKKGYSVENLESFLSFLGDEKIVTGLDSGRSLEYSLTVIRNRDYLRDPQFLDGWFRNLQNIDFQFLEEKILSRVNTSAEKVLVVDSFLRSREENFSFDDLERNIFPMLIDDDEGGSYFTKKLITLSWLENRSVNKGEFIKACKHLGLRDIENNIGEVGVYLGIKKESLIVSEDEVRVNVSNNIVGEEEIKIESEGDAESLLNPAFIFNARQAGDGVASSLVKWLDSYPKDVNEELFLQVINLAESDSEKLEIICSWPFSRLSNEEFNRLSNLLSDEKAKSQLLGYFVAFNQGECSYEQVASLAKEDRSLVGKWIKDVDYKLSCEELVGLNEYLDAHHISSWFQKNKLDEGDINEAISKAEFFYKNSNDEGMTKRALLGYVIKNRSAKTIDDVSLVLEQFSDAQDKGHVIASLASNLGNLRVEDIVALYRSLPDFVANDEFLRLTLVRNLLPHCRVTSDEFESQILPLIPSRDRSRMVIANDWLSRYKDQDEQLKLLKLFATHDVVGPEVVGKCYFELNLNRDDLITNCEDFYQNNKTSQTKMLLAVVNADSKGDKEVRKKIITDFIAKSKEGDVILKVLSQSRDVFNEGEIFDIVNNAALADIDLGRDYKNLSEILKGKTLEDVLSPEDWKDFNKQLNSRVLIRQDTPFALVLLSMKLAGDESLKKLANFLNEELRLEISSVFIAEDKPYLSNLELPRSLGITSADMVSVQKLADSIRPKVKSVPQFNGEGFDKQIKDLAGDLFVREVEEITEDEVAEFFEKLFHLESKISGENKVLGSERSKLHRVFQGKRNEIAYMLQQEGGLAAVGDALYSIADGCVANFGTYLNKTVNRFLIDDKNVLRLYTFFESFAAEMLNSVGVDTLGGNRAGLDILNNRFNDRFCILPNIFLEKFSQNYSSVDGVEILESIKVKEYVDELRNYIENQGFADGAENKPDYELTNRIASLLIVQRICPEITNHPFAKNFLDSCRDAMSHCETFVSDISSTVDRQQSSCFPSAMIFSGFVQRLFGNESSKEESLKK